MLSQLGLGTGIAFTAEGAEGATDNSLTLEKLAGYNTLKDTPGAEQFNYLLQMAKRAPDEKKEKFREALRRWSGGDNEAAGLMKGEGGIWDFLTDDKFNKLRKSTIGLRAPGTGLGLKQIEAFGGRDVGILQEALIDVIMSDTLGQFATPGNSKDPETQNMTKAIFSALKNTNLEELKTEPFFIMSKGKDYIGKTLKAVMSTKAPENVENYNEWDAWNEKFMAFRTGKKDGEPVTWDNLPQTQTGYGSIAWKKAQTDAPEGFRGTWWDLLVDAYGTKMQVGKNTKIEEILKKGNDFTYKDLLGLGEARGDPVGKIKSLIQDASVDPTGNMANYAPFGYNRGFLADAPGGDVNLRNKIKFAGKKGWVPPIKGQDPAGPKVDDKGNLVLARGFVPNFSAIAGEIAASQAAGYAKSVTSSQVRTMNIPGQGTTAYNTQESVFKSPGMRQPFIVPPADSKAAPDYSKKVKSKFGFSPYANSADGFIPNLAPSSSPIVKSFMRSLKIFGDVLLGPVQLALEHTSKDMSDAAKEMKDVGEQEVNINTEHLEATVGDISAALVPLAALKDGITINDGGLAENIKTLNDSLSKVSGEIKIDPVKITVDIQADQVLQSAFSSSITPRLINILTEALEAKIPKITEEVLNQIR